MPKVKFCEFGEESPYPCNALAITKARGGRFCRKHAVIMHKREQQRHAERVYYIGDHPAAVALRKVQYG